MQQINISFNKYTSDLNRNSVQTRLGEIIYLFQNKTLMIPHNGNKHFVPQIAQ